VITEDFRKNTQRVSEGLDLALRELEQPATAGADIETQTVRIILVGQRLMWRPWGRSCSGRDHCLTGEHNEA